MHLPKAQCRWGGNDHEMQPLEQGTGEEPRQCRAHTGFCGKEPVPSNQGKEELSAHPGLDGALMAAWTWSHLLGSGTDHAKSPALRKKQFESSTNL